MKSVLISIKPKYCELIVSGQKTVEVRKTKPRIDTPFKCYIYKTTTGKVIAEFDCDGIYPIRYTMDGFADVVDCKLSRLRPKDFIEYGKGTPLYGWRITNLKVYDEPKELVEFRRYLSFFDGESIAELEESGISNIRLKRPPRSWCYVEGLRS